MPLKYLFVLNKGSGSSSSSDWEERIRKFFSGTTEAFEIYHLPEKIDIPKIRKEILANEPGRIVAVGGDGTVSLLASMLIDTNIPLGILPAGSANGMAKELNIPSSPDDALKILRTGIIQPADLVKVNDRYSLHLSDLGMNAQLIKHFEEGKLRGKWGYARVVLKTLLATQQMHVSVKSGNETVSRTAVMVVLANSKTYGTGAVINPEGKIDDGLLEVIIVKKLKVGALLRMFLRPGLFNPKNIEIISCSEAEVHTHRPMHFQIDGEYMGREKKVNASIKTHAISLILPGE